MEIPQRQFNADVWQIDRLRVSLFFEGLDLSDVGVAFKAVTDKPADRESMHRGLQGVQKTAEGPWESGQLTIATQTGRLDAILTGPNELPLAGEFQVLAKFNQLGTAVEELPRRLIGFQERITRLAIAFSYINKRSDSADAYKGLSEELPFIQISWLKARDFNFQLNYPRSIQVADRSIDINRIATWRCAYMKLAGMDAEGKMIEIPTPPVFGVNLETDINTAHSDNLLEWPRPDIFSLADTLWELSDSILKDGHTP